jgi:hypothetical protein
MVGAGRIADGFGVSEHDEDWATSIENARAWWAENEGQPRFMVIVLSDGESNVLQSPELPRFPERKYQWLEPLDPRIGKLRLDENSVRSAYVRAAQTAGTALGGLLGSLEGDRERWVVLSSTNGMSLTERGGFHESPVPLLTNNLLVDRSIRVPLVLSGPGLNASTAKQTVELRDVFPTVADVAGAVVPAGVDGTSLRQESGGLAYAEFGDMLWVRDGAYTLTFRCTQHNATSIDPGLTETLLDPRTSQPAEFYSLYNVEVDPMQDNNIRQTEADRFSSLQKTLMRLRTGEAAVPTDSITPERLWALRMAPSDGYW